MIVSSVKLHTFEQSLAIKYLRHFTEAINLLAIKFKTEKTKQIPKFNNAAHTTKRYLAMSFREKAMFP